MIRDMRERIVLQKSITRTDKNGNHVLEWQDFFSCAAYVNNLSGKEYWAAAQVNAQTDLYFVIRYCSELKGLTTDKYQIVFRDQRYNITFIDNVQYKNQTLKIRATKVVR